VQFDAQLIAAAIQSRNAFETIAAHFDSEEFSTVPKFWFPLVKGWYARDNQAKSIDRDALIEAGKLRITNPKHEEVLTGFIRDLPEPPSADNLVQVALEFKRHMVGMELGAAIGARDTKRVNRLLPEFNSLMAASTLKSNVQTEWQDAVDVEELFTKVSKENRIAIAPASLNEKAGGGALPGHHIIVFGRPEEGKSTFSVNFGGSMVKRGVRTAYFGNEDQIDILKSRMVSRLTGMTWEECQLDPKKASKLYRDAGGEEYLLMTQLKHGTVDAIRKRVEEYQPQVIIIDQIRNLHVGGGSDGEMTKKLEILGIAVRELLIDYGLIGLSVTQANDRTTGHNQRPPLWLGMGDMDSSRTGLPGQGDLIVGIGSNEEFQNLDRRALSIVKNKLNSGKGSKEGIVVSINKALSKVY
jgi:hypothetical protein